METYFTSALPLPRPILHLWVKKDSYSSQIPLDLLGIGPQRLKIQTHNDLFQVFDYAQYYLDLSDANRRDLEITGDDSSASGSPLQVRGHFPDPGHLTSSSIDKESH